MNIDFKIPLLVNKSLNGPGPDMLTEYKPYRSLRPRSDCRQTRSDFVGSSVNTQIRFRLLPYVVVYQTQVWFFSVWLQC